MSSLRCNPSPPPSARAPSHALSCRRRAIFPSRSRPAGSGSGAGPGRARVGAAATRYWTWILTRILTQIRCQPRAARCGGPRGRAALRPEPWSQADPGTDAARSPGPPAKKVARRGPLRHRLRAGAGTAAGRAPVRAAAEPVRLPWPRPRPANQCWAGR